MAEILKGTRKYRVGLTLAHHELRQLQRDPDVASAVMSHPYTRVVFRVGDDDAKKLAEGFSYFESKDLRNLETGRAVCRVERSDFDFNLSVPLPNEPDETQPPHDGRKSSRFREKSMARHGRTWRRCWRSRGKACQMVTPPTSPPAKIVSEPPKVAEVPTATVAQEADDEEGQHNAIKERIRVQAETLDYSVVF